jgi:hypothetical protein
VFAKMSTKPTKSLTAVLKLSPKTLSQFPHEAPAQPSPASKPASTPEASPAPMMADSTAADTPADTPAAMNGASTPSSLAPPGSKRKAPAPKAGTKRGASAIEGASTPKPRGKPGPKKRKMYVTLIIHIKPQHANVKQG